MSCRRLSIVLLGAVFCTLFAYADSPAITGQGLGIRAGYVFDYDNPLLKGRDGKKGIEPKDLSMIGGHLTLLSISKISVELAGEYSHKDYRVEIHSLIPDMTYTVPYKVQNLAMYATARYKLIDGTFGIHLGGGLNVHRFAYSADLAQIAHDVTGVVALPKDDWHTGFHVLVGVSFGLPALPFRAFGEARVAKINVSGDAAQLATVLAGVTFGAF